MTPAPAWPDARIDGPSYPVTVKSLATVLVAALLERGWHALDTMQDMGGAATGVLVGGVVVVLAGYWEVLTSRTAVDATSIRRRSLWAHEVRLADVTQVKLVRVPGLDWCIVPRLIVRSRGLGLATFRAGDARLLDAFRRIAHGG